jgi:ABC-2 type transport system ATP-binding protein
MSGLKNIRHYERMAVKEITEKRRSEVIKLVGLEDAIHQKVKTYSLGMRQRLGVAQSLLHSPSLLILDEPTNGLDPQGIREFRDYLRGLADMGISVLVSSHLLSEMQLMCDRFAIIEKGKLIHISSIHESIDESEKITREVLFEVNDSSQAAILIKENGLYFGAIEVKDDHLKLHIDREKTIQINQLLVSNGIGVFGITSHKATLEDRFLELTNKEKKEQMI